MKHKILCLLLAALLCLALCGCGSYGTQDGRRPGEMEILPDTSPLIDPDMDDGVVHDHDGIIEDHDTGNGHSGDPDSMTSPSPMPGESTAPTTSPTTAPSSSPRP